MDEDDDDDDVVLLSLLMLTYNKNKIFESNQISASIDHHGKKKKKNKYIRSFIHIHHRCCMCVCEWMRVLEHICIRAS